MYCQFSKILAFLFFGFWIVYFLPLIYAEVPVNPCPDYFRYFTDGKKYFGKVTVPKIPEGITKLEVHLSQKGVTSETNPSSLALYESQAESIKNFLNGKPITYRVEFPDPKVLPKLTLLSLNDSIICSGQDYPAPSTKIKLINNLSMKVSSTTTTSGLNDNSRAGKMVKSFAKPKTHTTHTGNPFIYHRFNSTKPSSQPHRIPTTPRIQNSNTFKTNPNNLFLQKVKSTENTNGLNEVCGRATPVITPLIRGGDTINRGEFPWLTAIYCKQRTDLKFTCGGSLISSRTVISAAHCFNDYKQQEKKILVLLGRNNLGVTEEEGGIQREISSLVLHPEYNLEAISDADIALLQLKSPVTFTKYISPLCLWNTATDVSIIVGSKAYVAGWGSDEYGVTVSERPKKIETHITDEIGCKQSLRVYQTLPSSRTICVKAKENAGPCTGDSGGGLVIYHEGHWTLRGIVSAGVTQHGKCISIDYYYFSDVAKHSSWIQRNMLQ